MRGKGGRGLLGAIAAVLIVGLACTPTGGAPVSGPAQSEAPKPALLRVSIPADVRTLDPAFDNAGLTQAVLRNVFDPLVERNEQGKIVGVAAESWRVVNPTTWEFKLRSGMKFHNGDAVTAEDAAFTVNRILDEKNNSPLRAFISAIGEAKAVDTATVQIITKQPYTALLVVLPSAPIVSKKAVTELGADRYGKAPIGSGPYKFGDWVKDDHITLHANEGYWKGKPPVQTITFKPIPEPGTRAAALQTDQVDLVMDLPEQFMKDIEAKSDLKVSVAPGIRTHQIIIDSNVRPFSDVRVRQAIQHAIDYDSLLKNVLGGIATRNCQVVSPDSFGYDTNLRCPGYDPARAKQLLAEAGLPNGFEAQLGGASGARPHDREIQEAVAGMLEKVGIRLKLNLLEANRWVQGYAIREWPLTYHTNSGPGDMEYVFGFGFYSKTSRGYWKDPVTTDPLIDQSRAEFDPTKREVILKQISKLLVDQAAWVVIHNQADVWAMKKSLKFAPVAEKLDMSRASW